jgi:MFS family permease
LGYSAAGVLVGLFDSFAAIFIVNSVAFCISAVLIHQIQYSPEKPAGRRTLTPSIFLTQVRDGIRISFGSRLLVGNIAALGLTMLGAGATNVLTVPLLVNDLKIPETWMGGTGISETVAMIIGGSLIAGLSTRINPTRVVPWSLIGFGMGMIMVFAVRDIWQAMGVLFFSSLFIPGINSTTQTILQTAVPDALRGRVNSARMVIVMIANLASMGAAGVLADKMGAGNVFIISGSLAILGGLAAMLIFRGVKLEPIAYEADSMTGEIIFREKVK